MLQLIGRRVRGLREWHRRGCLLRYVLGRLLVATRLCRLLTVERAGYVLRFHPSALATTLWACPSDRDEDHAVLERLVRTGDQVVDVGANIGDLALHAAALVGPHGRVIAIEPHPRTFGFLQENVTLNGAHNVVLYNLALGAENGSASLSDQRSDDQNTILTSSAASGSLVPLRRLDHLEISGRIHLLKIDVEGFEKFVLEGATTLLDRVDVIYFEAVDAQFRRFGYTAPDLLFWLEARSFRICAMTSAGELELVSPAEHSGGYHNLLAVRPGVYEHLSEEAVSPNGVLSPRRLDD